MFQQEIIKDVIARLKEHQSPTPSKWRERAEWRMQNKSWLRHSQRIAVRMLEKMDELSMTLNKHQHVRAALCWQTEIAHLARQHNDANVLVMPGRFLTLAEADAIMGEFLSTPFEGGRHMRRIEKIPCQG